MKHGAMMRTCSHEGCTNYAQKGGRCYQHGEKRKTCSHEGCSNFAQKGGVCKRLHGTKVDSSITARTTADSVVSDQALGSTVASIKNEYDEETVGSINNEEENCGKQLTAVKNEELDEETDSEAAEKCEWSRIKQEDTDNEGD